MWRVFLLVFLFRSLCFCVCSILLFVFVGLLNPLFFKHFNSQIKFVILLTVNHAILIMLV